MWVAWPPALQPRCRDSLADFRAKRCANVPALQRTVIPFAEPFACAQAVRDHSGGRTPLKAWRVSQPSKAAHAWSPPVATV